MKYTLASGGDRSSTWRMYSGEGVSRSTSHPFKKDRNGIDPRGILSLATSSQWPMRTVRRAAGRLPVSWMYNKMIKTTLFEE